MSEYGGSRCGQKLDVNSRAGSGISDPRIRANGSGKVMPSSPKYSVEHHKILYRGRFSHGALQGLEFQFSTFRICRYQTGVSTSFYEKLYIPLNRLTLELAKIEGTDIGLSITRELIELVIDPSLFKR